VPNFTSIVKKYGKCGSKLIYALSKVLLSLSLFFHQTHVSSTTIIFKTLHQVLWKSDKQFSRRYYVTEEQTDGRNAAISTLDVLYALRQEILNPVVRLVGILETKIWNRNIKYWTAAFDRNKSVWRLR